MPGHAEPAVHDVVRERADGQAEIGGGLFATEETIDEVAEPRVRLPALAGTALSADCALASVLKT